MSTKTKWRMKGQYVKNCNCIASCPCDTAGRPYPDSGCEGMLGMHIVTGNFGDVKLDGLNWVATYYWPGALHEGNGIMQPFVDQRATPEQRNALLQILSGQSGGTFFEILKLIVVKIHEPQFLPIQFEFDKKKRMARVIVPGFLETVSEPLKVPVTGDEQKVVVQMPIGFEYKEMEVASCAVLKGTGPIKFDHKGTHSSLADVDHTQDGLVA